MVLAPATAGKMRCLQLMAAPLDSVQRALLYLLFQLHLKLRDQVVTLRLHFILPIKQFPPRLVALLLQLPLLLLAMEFSSSVGAVRRTSLIWGSTSLISCSRLTLRSVAHHRARVIAREDAVQVPADDALRRVFEIGGVELGGDAAQPSGPDFARNGDGFFRRGAAVDDLLRGRLLDFSH